MDQSQIFSREITVSMSLDDVYNFILGMSKIKDFSILNENKVLNKIIVGFLRNKIEIFLDQIDDKKAKMRIAIMDHNDNYYPSNEISSNIAMNFENGLTCIVEGNPDKFKVQAPNIDFSVDKLLQLLLFIAAIAAVILGLNGLFS
jgi:hypothetical protein